MNFENCTCQGTHYSQFALFQVDRKPVVEGNVQLSTQMLTAIPEVDLGME